MVVAKNCHVKLCAHFYTSRKPGDELLIDRSLPDMALWLETNMTTGRSGNLEELARRIIHNVKGNETSHPDNRILCTLSQGKEHQMHAIAIHEEVHSNNRMCLP